MAQDAHQKVVSRGRALTLVSIGIILFILGDGEFQDGVTVNLIGLTLNNVKIFYIFSLCAFAWIFWRFHQSNPSPVMNVKGELKDVVRKYGNPAPEIIRKKTPPPKVPQKGHQYFIELLDINFDKVDIRMAYKPGAGSTQHQGIHEDTFSLLSVIGWLLPLIKKTILQKEGTADYFSPYLFAFFAAALIVIEAWLYVLSCFLAYYSLGYFWLMYKYHMPKPLNLFKRKEKAKA